MGQRDELKKILEEIHKLAEESILYLPIMESLDHEEKEPLIKDEKIDYSEIKHLVKEAMREAEEERAKRLAQYYAELCGEEE